MTRKNTNVRMIYRSASQKWSMALAIGLLMLTGGTLNAQIPAPITRTLNVNVDGLPAGLNVAFVLQVPICNGTVAPVPTPVGTVTLTEHDSTRFENVVGPGGIITLRLVTRVNYLGQLIANLPGSTGCQASATTTAQSFYSIAGEQNGSPALRRTNPVGRILTNSTVSIDETISAFTQEINDANAFATPTSLNRSTTGLNRWAVAYDDPFGAGSVVVPSLAFTQAGFSFGGVPTTFTRIKMSLTTTGQVCLLVDGTTVCRARSLGGNLVNGPVTVNVSQISDSSNQIERSVTWAFRIDPSFDAGNFTVVGSADDNDPMDYLVDGEPQTLNLLPWKVLRIPVTVN